MRLCIAFSRPYYQFTFWSTILCSIWLIFLSHTATGQGTTTLDSLRSRAAEAQTSKDTSLVVVYQHLSSEFESVDMDSAHYYAQQAAALSKHLHYVPGQLKSLQQLAFVAYSQLRFAEGITYAKQGLALAEPQADLPNISVFSNTLAILYDELGDYPQAITCYQQSLQTAETDQDSTQIGRVLNNIGVTYYQIKNYDKALEYYQRALAIYQTLNEKEMIGRSLSKVASIYYAREDLETAVRITQQALTMAEEADDTQQITYDLFNLAEMYQTTGASERSSELVNRSIQLAERLNDYGILTMGYKLRGTLLSEQGHYDSARADYERALNLTQTSGNLNEEQKVHRAIIQLDSLLGNYQRAFLRQGQYLHIKDSLFSLEKTNQVEKLQMRYETEEKDQQIALLRSENEVKSLKVSQQATLRNVLVGSIIALFLLLGVLYSRYRLKRKSLRQIALKKQKIEQRNKSIEIKNRENEVLLREIHHRVKNNLQLILSLLNVQSQRFQDEAVLDFIREGQSRVRSMALVHQDLYQAERLDQVDFAAYLHKLVSHLATMYNTKQRGIDIDIDIRVGEVVVDVNVAIPLGLITNELVSNTLKHAFNDQPEGRVSIYLRLGATRSYRLTVADDGVGLPEGFDISQTKSLGLKLVRGLTQQLHGSLTVSNGQGSSFEVTFPMDASSVVSA